MQQQKAIPASLAADPMQLSYVSYSQGFTSQWQLVLRAQQYKRCENAKRYFN